jgi:hypothetical protein
MGKRVLAVLASLLAVAAFALVGVLLSRPSGGPQGGGGVRPGVALNGGPIGRDPWLAARVDECAPFLPENLTLATEFCETKEDVRNRNRKTIREQLIELAAYCRNGAIYDYRGRKTIFHWMRDVPPGMWMLREQEQSFLERVEQERIELKQLEGKGYTVMRMYGTKMPL